MPSFDIVSEIDMNQAKNAVENAKRELETRFDFRGVDAKIEFKKDHIELTAEADQQVMQLFDIFATKASKLQLDVSSFKIEKEDINPNIEAGTFETDGKTFLKFATNNGYIKLIELQLEGKKRMQVDEFLRGVRL